MRGQIGTIKLATEKAIGENVKTDTNLWQWMVEYCADTFNRYKIGVDGIILYKGAKGREPTATVAAVGEKILYHLTKEAVEGFFLGMLWMCNECAVGTSWGILRAHSIKRISEDKCWDVLMLN